MSTPTTDTEPLIVKLTPIGAGPPAEIRFRRALKCLRRCYGLRAHWLAKAEHAEALLSPHDPPSEK
ncbi:MAG TPA: hypothetical protein VIL86_07200 [Tepidisphaeraceae bacterium]|jgi:hypothetical protein